MSVVTKLARDLKPGDQLAVVGKPLVVKSVTRHESWAAGVMVLYEDKRVSAINEDWPVEVLASGAADAKAGNQETTSG